jgi:alkylhydroperoxidase family enzyme
VDATPDPLRIPPLPRAEWPEEMKAAVAALVPPAPRHPLPRRDEGRPKGLNVLGTFAQYPALAQAFHTFNGHVLFASTLSQRDRELLVLRVASLRRAAYEWEQHVVQARDAGLSDDEIARIAAGPDAPGWPDLDRAMLLAADELVGDGTISDRTWAALSTGLDQHQMMDLVFTVGAYEVLAMALRSFGVQLDDDLKSPEE